MNEKIGPQTHVIHNESFLDSVNVRRTMSDKTAHRIDEEVKNLLNECYERALKILERETYFLHVLSEILLDIETLDSEEFEIIHQCSLTKKGTHLKEIQSEDKECSLCPARGQCMKKVNVAIH
jgi:cell division protease FtsH